MSNISTPFYRLNEQFNDEQQITEYGINCLNAEGETICSIHSISGDKNFTVNIIDLLNKENVSIYHFKDIIEDLLI